MLLNLFRFALSVVFFARLTPCLFPSLIVHSQRSFTSRLGFSFAEVKSGLSRRFSLFQSAPFSRRTSSVFGVRFVSSASLSHVQLPRSAVATLSARRRILLLGTLRLLLLLRFATSAPLLSSASVHRHLVNCGHFCRFAVASFLICSASLRLV